MKSLIRSCFGRAAGSYYDAASVQKDVARICVLNCPAAHYGNVLDIGSGVGFVAENFNGDFSSTNYFSLDLTLPMLVEQQKRFMFPVMLAADGEYLPFRKKSFDLLLSSSAMQWYMKPEISIPETLEFLKPGGYFSFSVFIKGTLGELEDVSRRTGFGRMHKLEDERFYLNLFEGIKSLDFSHEVKDFVTLHPGVREFLKAHKMTGAGASSEKMCFGKESYRKFVSEYERLYSTDGMIKSTFRSLFIYGRKKGI
ncbi:methyltransferase domain-containing protein [Maridesulfovibrio bastinii]|uniref:methyltransferase domain-containing protein n=1 Tax=Maridesulfovibrio bastinii TaxID=47157 RepID=UPI000424DA02|nr:methyltransferase domain-containing protein [Maridesulfovibrio bastinii]